MLLLGLFQIALHKLSYRRLVASGVILVSGAVLLLSLTDAEHGRRLRLRLTLTYPFAILNVPAATLEGHLLKVEVVAAFAGRALGQLVEDKFGVLVGLAVVADLITRLVGLVNRELVLLIWGVFQVISTHRQDNLIRSLCVALSHTRAPQGFIRASVEIL